MVSLADDFSNVKSGWTGEISLTATANKCKALWTSFGIFMVTVPYLDKEQATRLQQLNKFTYNIGIGRVISSYQVCYDNIYVGVQRIPNMFQDDNRTSLFAMRHYKIRAQDLRIRHTVTEDNLGE